jgi:nicotinate-nucleotide pyrophosphorylase (carboxylating)
MVTRSAVRALIQQALREDVGQGDLTSRALLPPGQRIRAEIIAKQSGIVAGVQIAAWIFHTLDRRIRCTIVRRDGHAVRSGQLILRVEGPARSILTAERTALNLLGHLCGIATLTSQFVHRAKPHRAVILDTRKTLPGLRLLEKYAVAMGGGANHRMRLDDAVLIKTNHLRAGKLTVNQAIRRAKRLRKPVEVEVKNFAEFTAALGARPAIIMLDNWTLPAIRRAVALRNTGGRKPLLEASGGITLQSIRRFAATGVERISIGRLTHSAPALDLALRVS